MAKKISKKSQKPKPGLRGKFIITRRLAGRVLNDAEKEPFVALQVLRERHERKNDAVSQLVGWAPNSAWWVACDKEINTTREHLGTFEVLDKMPEWLHIRNIGRPSGAPLIIRVKGKGYICW